MQWDFFFLIKVTKPKELINQSNCAADLVLRTEATRFADDTRNPSTLFFPLLAQLVKAFRRTMELFVLRAPPALEEPFNGLDQRSKHSNKKNR